MRIIQTKVLPNDWLQKVSCFDVGTSTLSRNTKVIANRLIEFIIEERNYSLLNPSARSLALHVVFGKNFFTGFYDRLPVELIEEGINETKGVKGFNFTRKLHSVFVEFIIYKKLYSNGFNLKNITRTRGSCDLVMEKHNKDYNFEVKFKESKDVFKSRLFDNIDGMSLLDEYGFLRGEIYDIQVKSQNIDDRKQKEVLDDIKCFIENKKDQYIGKHIDIFNLKYRRKVSRDIKKVSECLTSLHISQELTDEDTVYKLIQNIFIEDNGHITKLIKKSKTIENFNGCLVWDIPFHNDINLENIKNAFNRLKLGFNLYVFIGGRAKAENYFIVEKHSL
ncbi:MAG: hypothetical protein HRU40_21130 [Saprospiraceae bacterium]|nr:hypothetical protein [Saprospiraceae bacterium]